MNTPVRSLLLLALGAALGAALMLVWRPGAGSGGVPDTPGREALREGPHATSVGPGAFETAPSLQGHPPRALEDLRPTAAETEWLRSTLARERERLASSQLRSDDSGLQVLERVLDFGTDPALTMFTSFEVFRDRVRPSGAAPLAIAAGGDRSALSFPALGMVTVIDLGPGTFRLDDPNARWSALREGVESVEIRGAGKDATTLVAGHQWALLQSNSSPAGRRLTLRDLTFDGETAEGSLLDLRDAAAVRLERVRVRGWQLSGHAAAIGVSGRTYLVADGCEFDGGGRTSGFGISLRGPALVWARGCLFADIGHSAIIVSDEKAKGGLVRLEDCTFVNTRVLDRVGDCPVEVRGARVEFGAAALTEQERGERWGRTQLTAAEGVTFAPGVPRCTLGDLLEVLRRTSVPDAERVTRLELGGLRQGKPHRFTLETRTSGRSRPAVYTLVLEGGRVDMTLRPQAGGHGAPDEAVLAKAPSLRSALEHAALASDVPMRVVEYAVERGRGGEPDVVVLRVSEDQRTFWDLDAATGAVLRAPRQPN